MVDLGTHENAPTARKRDWAARALDFARDKLDVDAPAADLLYTDAYTGLMHFTRSGLYLGPSEAAGEICDHVAFRGDHADWELWVKQGNQPLPMRYTITTTDQSVRPEFVVEIHDWNVSRSSRPTSSPSRCRRPRSASASTSCSTTPWRR